MGKYSVGLDFGSLSGRAVIIDIGSGEEIATAVMSYPHGIMSERLPDGTPLPPDHALQHPRDYLDVLYTILNECISKANISPKDIVGVAVDCTASTFMPVNDNLTPLCVLPEYSHRPHAYVKMWKHHSASDEAAKITETAKKMGLKCLERQGGKISGEMFFPKLLETLNKDPELYKAAYRFIEIGDWLVYKLTGKETHSACIAGFKAMWDPEEGYPTKEFFAALHPEMKNVIGTKVSADVHPMNEHAGVISAEAAKATGLAEGTPVYPAFIDAHAALPAVGITQKGEMLGIIGTSSCHIMLSETEVSPSGTFGCVKNGVVEGYYACEAGQNCVGDSFAWFVDNCVPYRYVKEAERLNISIHSYLTDKAGQLPPGANGVLALDWWNGSRTPYMSEELSGVIAGLTIHTLPEEIYRALIESTAYGTRRIIELYENSGASVSAIYAAGGISAKNELLLQIYADVTGKEVKVCSVKEASAYGMAIYAAVNKNGYSSFTEAINKLGRTKEKTYKPNAVNATVYNRLYTEYEKLCVYFAEGGTDTVGVLKQLKSGK